MSKNSRRTASLKIGCHTEILPCQALNTCNCNCHSGRKKNQKFKAVFPLLQNVQEKPLHDSFSLPLCKIADITCRARFLHWPKGVLWKQPGEEFSDRADRFSNSLIIHKEKTKELTTVKKVWICDPKYHKILWTFALNFSNNH